MAGRDLVLPGYDVDSDQRAPDQQDLVAYIAHGADRQISFRDQRSQRRR
jgi:hypothetical protein